MDSEHQTQYIKKKKIVWMTLLSELFLTKPLESHWASATGNYQVKSARTWIIQWGYSTIKSGSNQPMLPNSYSLVHTWINTANNLTSCNPTATPLCHPHHHPTSLEIDNIKTLWQQRQFARDLLLATETCLQFSLFLLLQEMTIYSFPYYCAIKQVHI